MRLPFHVFNLASQCLPSRSHRIRAWLLELCGAKLGRNVCLNANVFVYDPQIEIGDDTWISPETILMSSRESAIRIGSRCDIGPGVLMTTGSHETGGKDRRAGSGISQPIIIGDGTWIGARSLLLGGAKIGKGTIVAAGAVVIAGEYPDHVLLAGVPAVVKERL